MELTEKYLDEVTLIADFWIAKPNKDITAVVNEGIAIQKSTIYLKKYNVKVILTKKAYDEIELFAKDWHKRFPKAVITKGSERVECYDLKYIGMDNKGAYVTLNFVGELAK